MSRLNALAQYLRNTCTSMKCVCIFVFVDLVSSKVYTSCKL